MKSLDTLRTTVRQILPYRFQLCLSGKLAITNLRDQTLLVSPSEVMNILQRDDLDVHRRRMYEAALEEFRNPTGGSYVDQR